MLVNKNKKYVILQKKISEILLKQKGKFFKRLLTFLK